LKAVDTPVAFRSAESGKVEAWSRMQLLITRRSRALKLRPGTCAFVADVVEGAVVEGYELFVLPTPMPVELPVPLACTPMELFVELVLEAGGLL
jgi:hypothetical protein